jgi:hypothetical protein
MEITRAWLGGKDLAFEQLVPLPSAVRATSGQLKLLPFCDPPRGDPRFDKIVASLVPKETEK